MFKKNPDGMRMEPTPERVLSVCRMVARKKISREELREVLTLGKDGEKELDQIDKSITLALDEISAIKKKDNFFELAVSEDVIASPEAFRKFVSAKVFSRKDTTFTMFTKWLVSQNDKIFALKNWEIIAKTCAAEIQELSSLDENAVLGWRFWASFLGVGYLSRTMILPNMKIRLQDILANNYSQSFKYGETVRATDFITWLSSKMPEADLTGTLPLAVSAGLRSLDELHLIKLEAWRDSNRIKLFLVDSYPLNDFSHITVSEEVCK